MLNILTITLLRYNLRWLYKINRLKFYVISIVQQMCVFYLHGKQSNCINYLYILVDNGVKLFVEPGPCLIFNGGCLYEKKRETLK
jgi:hypothetical protein